MIIIRSGRIVGTTLAALALALAAGCGTAGTATVHPGTAASPVPAGAGTGGSGSPPAGPAAASPQPASPQPSGTGTAALAAGSLAGRVIAIDPGHNGGNAAHPEVINKLVNAVSKMKPCDTTGTQTNAGYPEAAFTFDVSMRLAALLRAAGATVVLTRTDNTSVGPCITQRAAIGNDAHAQVAISIHADGAPAADHGFHVMVPVDVHGPSTAILPASRRLGTAIRDAYRAGTGIPTANYIGTDGINPRADMGGLNLSTVPKVLLECGNMRNAGDAARFTDAAARQRMAAAIATGLYRFLTQPG